MLANDEIPIGGEPPKPRRFLRPGFRTLLPVQVGKYMVKMSSSDTPTLICVVYWKGRSESAFWIFDSVKPNNCKVVFFTNEDKTKEFFNKLEKE